LQNSTFKLEIDTKDNTLRYYIHTVNTHVNAYRKYKIRVSLLYTPLNNFNVIEAFFYIM